MLCALLALFGVNAWAAVGDVTTNADIDFSNAITDGVVVGTVNQIAIGTGGAETIIQDGWLRLGDHANVVTIAESERAGARDAVTISFKMAFGNKNGMGSGFRVKDAEGNAIATYQHARWNGNPGNTLGIDMSGLLGAHSGNKAVAANATSYEIVFDYATKQIVSTLTLGSTTKEFTVEMTNTNPIASFEVYGYGAGSNADRASIFDDLKIATTEGNYNVQSGTYTVNYVYNGTIVETTERTGDVGNAISLLPSDKAPRIIDGQKYFYVSDDSEGKTVIADGSVVITITLRQAEIWNYVFNATLDGEVLKTFATGTVVEGELVGATWPRYALNGNKLAYKDAVSNSYYTTFTPTANNAANNVAYQNFDGATNVVFFSEAEDIATLEPITDQYLPNRFSAGRGAYAKEDGSPITSVEQGMKYKLTARLMGTQSVATFKFRVGNRVIWQHATSSNSFYPGTDSYTEEFVAAKNAEITLDAAGGDGSSGKVTNAVDYIYLEEIGAATEAEIAEAVAADEAADAAAALQAAKDALQADITAAKAIDTTDKEGVEELNAAIAAAETAAVAEDATVESLNAAKEALEQAVEAFIDANTIKPAYGPIWEGTLVCADQTNYNSFALSTDYFKDFAQVKDIIRVSYTDAGVDAQSDEARGEAPMRQMQKTGAIRLIDANETVIFETGDELKGDDQVLEIEITDDILGKLTEGDKIYVCGRNLTITKVELVEFVKPLISTYFVNADFASTEGWNEVVSGQFRDYGNGLIGEYNVRISPATVDETHLATEYCFGFECRWSTNYASYTQESITELPAGAYKLTFDVENVNDATTAANYENRFTVTVGDKVYTDQSTEWMQGKSSWTTHTIEFTVPEDAKVTLSLGYGTGSNNFGANNTPALYVSHLDLVFVKSAAEAAIEVLQAEIAVAEEMIADESKTEGREDFQAAIDAAKALLTSTVATDILAGVETLKAAEKAFEVANLPVQEGTYYVYNPLTEKFLSRGNAWGTSAVVDDYGVAVNVTVADGKYSLTSFDNNTTYGDDTWMYADAGGTRARTFIINKAEGGFTLTNTNNNQLVYVYLKEDGDKFRVAGNAAKDDNYTDDAQTIWQFITPAERNEMIAAREVEQKATAFESAQIAEDAELIEGDAVEVSTKTGNTWTTTVVRTQDGQPSTNEYATEMWQATGYMTQTISEVPSGLYKVSIQAFYRNGSADEDVARTATGMNTVLAYLEANGNKTQVKSWSSDKGESNDPNSMAAAAAKFDEGKYLSEVYTYVGEDGQLNLTISNPGFIGNGWFIVGNVKYQKISAVEKIEPVYGEIWNAETGKVTEPAEGVKLIALSTDYFKDFVKANDTLRVNISNVRDQEARSEAPRRNMQDGVITLIASNEEVIDSKSGLQTNDPVDFVITDTEKMGEGEFVYVRYEHLQVVSIELLQNKDATGINDLNATRKFDGTIYNLRGQKVENAQKGLYIMGGKKVVVK